ncbi:DUF420 domain-containing protein [Arachidicoccus soli]|uniref:DUF420 domain-containing protein n=1 Tax=Arachidicoccus soli TaxID=2341117 RepID=A0A386HKQ6_9BACT|nr:DUF420 domain-containing protein [Arachidicoccus soli]AYD46242.1 DUF420 domain-containing protein [Arachidicoccus soli]
MLEPSIQKNDYKARWLIGVFSTIVFCVIVALGKFKLTQVNLGFNPHVFAKLSAIINVFVAILLVAALIAVKSKKYLLHKRIMLSALLLSVLFLVCYIGHNLFAGETKFGGVGAIRTFYFVLLITHILLAAVMLPIILFTAYRGLTGEFEKHKKLARMTWPLWLYIAVSGPVVYWLISPYYR